MKMERTMEHEIENKNIEHKKWNMEMEHEIEHEK